MKEFQKSFDSLADYLRKLGNMGVMEEGQLEDIEKAIEAIRHELKVGNLKRLRNAINDLARVFLRGDR